MKRLVRFGLVMMAAAALTVASAQASWKFWSSDKKEAPKGPQVERKLLFKVPDDASEKELLTFLRSRELVTRDVIVLRRLMRAKQAQFADIQDRLQKKFGIQPSAQYEYDTDAMVVFEVGADKAQKKEFRKLTDKKEGELFLELLGLRRRLDSDVVVLQRIEKEQSDNLTEIHNVLLRKYGVRQERQYQYDRKEKALYEVTVTAPPVGSKEQADSKEQDSDQKGDQP